MQVLWESSEILKKGDEAAALHEEYFKKLSEELKRKRTTLKPDEKPFKAEKIIITGNSRTSYEDINKVLGIEENETVSNKELTRAVSLLYGTGDYRLIRYTAKDDTLSLNLIESPPETNSFGINYNNYDGASLLLNTKTEGFLVDSSTARFKLKLGRKLSYRN